MNAITGPAAYSPEWHALRKYDPNRNPPVVIGASDAATVCGVGYKTPLQLYHEILGEYNEEPDETTRDLMEFGTFNEPLVIRRLSRRLGRPIETGLPAMLSPLFPWMSATPDGRYTDDDGKLVGVEAKTTSEFRYDKTGESLGSFGQEGSDAVPLEYVLQCQQQMLVCGFVRVLVPVMFSATTLRVYTVERDDETIEAIIDREREFVERIKDRKPPEPDYTAAETVKLLAKMRPTVGGKTITWGDDELAMIMQRQRISEAMKGLKAQDDELKARLFDRMEDAQAAIVGNMTVKRIDVKEARIEAHTKAGYSYLLTSTKKGA